jgi:predicted transcriptional regulator
MNSRIKQYILIAVVAAAGYFIMSNHFIFNGGDVRLLKKTELHLHYTFYSIKQKKPKVIMKIDYLREAGIGDLLVDMGIINEEEKSRLESKYY